MSLKQHITASYGASIYATTTKLKTAKMNMAKAKNQLIFLQKCLAHKLIPKSLRVRSPLQSQRTKNILMQFRVDLLRCAKNDAKQRYFSQTRNVNIVRAELQSIINDEDMTVIEQITEKAREGMFKRSKDRLMKKFQNLRDMQNKNVGSQQKRTKAPLLNLVGDEIPKHHEELLNLGPKFVPTEERIPFMDVISTTESSALKLEYGKKTAEAQTLRKDVLSILKMAKPVKDNLTKEQRKAIKEIKKDDEVRIYPFDKGSGLVRIRKEDAIEKIREQIGNTTILSEDPTKTFATNIKSLLCKLRKKGRFSDKEYEKLYPSDPVPPRMYGTVKAHKPEKQYPMRVVVSTIGTANYGISEYIVKIAQNTLNKNKTRVKDSQSFVEEAKTWEIDKNEVQVSYDVVNLYPSIPVKEATEVLIDQLSKDDELKKYTKLTIREIKSLIDICVSRCYFIWNDEIHELQNSGPIGLSLMVVLAEGYLQFLEAKAFREALHQQPPLQPKTFRRFVDDSHSRFQLLLEAQNFRTVLNRQDPRVQYTMEVEKEDKSLAFLRIRTVNSGKGRYEFDVYRKEAITNVQVKPNSCHDPRILQGIFKGFVHQAFKICSKNYLEKELEFLTSVFLENGYEKKDLSKIIADIRRKFNEQDAVQVEGEVDTKPTVTLPWIPGVSPKLRKVYKKAGYKTAFKSGANLQTILTSKNKTILPKNSHPGTYKIQCKCHVVPPYIGETKIQIRNRNTQHEDYVIKGNWSNSGAAWHEKTCQSGFEPVETIKVDSHRFTREVREALEIQKHRSGPKEGGVNKDDGKHVKTKFWLPMMLDLHKKEKEEPKIRERRRIRQRARQQGSIGMTSNMNTSQVTSDTSEETPALNDR